MSDVVLGIRIKLSGQEVTDGARRAAAELEKIRQTTKRSNDESARAADQFTAMVRKQADTLGMSRAQVLAYEAAQHNLNAGQREMVAQSIQSIAVQERLEQMLSRVKVASAAVAAVFVAGAKAAVAAAQEAEQAELRLQAVLRATGGVAGLSSQELIAMAEDFQQRLGINDEAVKNAMAVLLTFRSVSRDSFGEAMEVAANLAKVMGTDLQSAVLQLGKALEEPEIGLTALRRAGVSFSETQKQLIKDLVETGDQSRAITTILQIMKEQGLDRVAEAMHQGLARATSDLKNTWDDLLEALGRTKIVKGTIESVFGSLKDYLLDMKNVIESGNWFERLGFFLFGYSSARIVAARNHPEIVAARNHPEEQTRDSNELDLGADVAARRALENARDAYESFMRQFRTNNEKLAEDLRKLDALYKNGAMSAEEYAKARQKIFEKYQKPRSVESLLFAGREEIQRMRQQQRAELDLLKAGLSAATKAYEGSYQDQEIELEAYYAARRAIVERGESAERAEIERSISALEAERARVLKLRGKDADEKAKIKERAEDLASQIEVARLALQKLDIETSSALAELARKEQQDRYQRIEQAMSRAQAIIQATESSLQSRVIIGLETEATARLKLRQTIGEQGRALERELLPKIQALMETTSDPRRLAELQAALDKIREMIETGRDKSFLEGVQSGLKEYATAVTDTFQTAKEAVGRAFRAMEDALVEFVTTGKLSFRGFVSSILSDMARLAIQRGITQPLSTMLGDFLGGIFKRAALGDVFAGAGISAYSGRVIDRPVVFPFAHGIGLMGEAGPEAVLPLKRGRDGRLGVELQGGGNTYNVSISVDASGSRIQGDAGQAAELGRRIEAAVKDVLVREKRPGGLLAMA